MYTIFMTIQVFIALALIGLILIQHGKGADAGAAFGAGASGTVFGARGSANFLSRATAVLATCFFAVSLVLAYLVSHQAKQSDSIVERAAVLENAEGQPAAPALVPDGEPADASKPEPVIPE